MKLGITLPLIDIQGDPATVRDFAQAAEGLGYDHLGAPDHVLGVNVASRPDWGARNTSKDFFHDPFVMFGFLSACTKTIEFSTQVMILAQRQTALVAKQAASLDVLSGGRFRFGIGVGWNPVEYVGLNENFHNRGKRSEEQVEVMRALWAEPHVTFKGQWHTIDDAGINPLPTRRSIPLWFGGHEDVTLAAHRQMGRRLDHAGAPGGPRGQCRVRQAARLRQGGGSGPERDRPRGVGVDGRRRPRGLAQAVPGLEGRRRHARHRQQHLPPGAAQAHRRPHHDRSPGGDDAVSCGRRRSHLIGRDAGPGHLTEHGATG